METAVSNSHDLDSFSTFLEAVDSDVAEERARQKGKSFQGGIDLDEQEREVIDLMPSDMKEVGTRVLVERSRFGLLEIARILAALKSKGLVRIDGSGNSEVAALTEEGARASTT